MGITPRTETPSVPQPPQQEQRISYRHYVAFLTANDPHGEKLENQREIVSWDCKIGGFIVPNSRGYRFFRRRKARTPEGQVLLYEPAQEDYSPKHYFGEELRRASIGAEILQKQKEIEKRQEEIRGLEAILVPLKQIIGVMDKQGTERAVRLTDGHAIILGKDDIVDNIVGKK